MKLHGRITVFGEYLLRENLSYCYCIKSKLFLSNSDTDSNFVHPTYEQGRDETIPLLRDAGVFNLGNIYGNLPFGYGLSSSTILSLLHMNSAHRRDLVVSIDKAMCGFSPSELDYTTITKQENGVLGFGKWQPINDFHPTYSLITIPKDKKRKLPEVIKNLSTTLEKQIEITKNLFLELATKNVLNYDLLFEYSNHLLSCDVYSEKAKEIVTALLQKNIVAKCVGGLYDKAILVVHLNVTEKYETDNFVRNTFNYATLIE